MRNFEQVDFGKIGLVPRPSFGTPKAVLSAHFHRLLLPAPLCLPHLPPEDRGVITGFEAAWAFSGAYLGL